LGTADARHDQERNGHQKQRTDFSVPAASFFEFIVKSGNPFRGGLLLASKYRELDILFPADFRAEE
jgi:hypothetical protein